MTFLSLSDRRILLLTFLCEGALSGIYLAWTLYQSTFAIVLPTWESAALGLLHAALLLVANVLIMLLFQGNSPDRSSLSQFVDLIVYPLAKSLSPPTIVIVSVLAGVGEELFFRGVLQEQLGWLLASILFGFMHFGTAVREYFSVFVLYVFLGGYIGLVYAATGSLWVVVVQHAVYDFLALLYLKYRYRPSVGESVLGPNC